MSHCFVFSIHLGHINDSFTEHRRHQILPGLVRDGYIGFQGIVLLVAGETHHDLWRHTFFQSMHHKGSSCSVCPYHITKGLSRNHSITTVPLHLGHLPGESKQFSYLFQLVIHLLVGLGWEQQPVRSRKVLVL